MRIDEFIWPEERIEHITRHGITPEEVEEACFGKSLVQRARRIAKSLFQGSYELQRFAEFPAQVIGSAADREVFGESGYQAERR